MVGESQDAPAHPRTDVGALGGPGVDGHQHTTLELEGQGGRPLGKLDAVLPIQVTLVHVELPGAVSRGLRGRVWAV